MKEVAGSAKNDLGQRAVQQRERCWIHRSCDRSLWRRLHLDRRFSIGEQTRFVILVAHRRNRNRRWRGHRYWWCWCWCWCRCQRWWLLTHEITEEVQSINVGTIAQAQLRPRPQRRKVQRRPQP